MSVTIKQIAERTGLSIPTVGNILGAAASRYSETTRQKVLEAVKEMGYRPNASARAMRSGRIGCAALVLSRSHLQTHSYIPEGLLNGLDAELSKHNMHLSVSLLTDEQLSMPEIVPKILREYAADGMIVNYTHAIPAPMLDLIHAHHVPAVWLNAKLAADCVYPDDFQGAHDATLALIQRGHRRVAFMYFINPDTCRGKSFPDSYALRHYSVTDRLGGYCASMRGAGLTPQIFHVDRFVANPEMVSVCKAFLSGPDRPTAVISYSLHETPAILVAAAELGLSIPRDLTIVQFWPTTEHIAGTLVPAIAIPTEASGRYAVEMLLRKIEAPNADCDPQPVPYRQLASDLIPPPRAE